MFSHKQLALSLFLAVFGATPCLAEIYKYKDEDGRWQFTDKPPKSEKTKVEIINTGGPKITYSQPTKNLAESLEKRYPSTTPVQKATQAVVSIDTKLGSGTGFFISDQGHIITNRHVVRPTTSSSWEDSKERFDDLQKQLDKQKSQLDNRKNELDKWAKDLKQYKQQIDSKSTSSRSVLQSEYDIYQKRYQEMKQDYLDYKKNYEKNKREINKQKSEFSYASNLSRASSRFKIKLKDSAVLYARLISVGKKHDLALLKLEGYTTPFIDIGNSRMPHQGEKVFAIGSPLGLRDFVTSGIVTNVKKNQIITDTQILPGNSGGPLVDEEGNIVGVNTLKLLSDRSIGSAGFGIAIPIKLINSEFGRALSSIQGNN